jgi:hypothetical protein
MELYGAQTLEHFHMALKVLSSEMDPAKIMLIRLDPHGMVDGRIFLKNLRASLFNEDLSNEPNFGPIHPRWTVPLKGCRSGFELQIWGSEAQVLILTRTSKKRSQKVRRENFLKERKIPE